ncbi:hypothetical protein [Pontibacter sp. BAB1700]|uniref:hypothetical protein n=1 Tax=Pontibacter sp. BAB1700 TaxID=1144253 RepID=UPI00026BD27B|nr:hypothetical protein [Pontibacter sp. BAB1700]EJF08534.1 hypothetical protein O71_20277 [Pontibacter sp. BAB1700]
MKIKFFITYSFIFAACTLGYSQKVMEVNMNDKDCIHVIDGLISSPNESALTSLLILNRRLAKKS